MSISLRKRNTKRFWYMLTIYFAVMLVLIAAGLAVFWGYIKDYEFTRPEKTMDALLGTFGADRLPELIEDSFNKSSSFETWETVGKYFNKNLRYEKRVAEYRSSNPVYTVRNDNEIAKVELVPAGTTKYGFTVWECGTVTLLADFSEAGTHSVTLKVPSFATVKLNGVTAGREYIVSTEKYNLAAVWEREAKELPECSLYIIKGLYTDPDISVTDTAGNTLAGSADENGVYVYDFPGSMRHSLTITVPSDAAVKVGGVLLTESEVTSGSVPYPGMDIYSAAAQVVPHRTVYTLDGLFTYPEVKVTASTGETLTAENPDKGVFIYGYPESAYHTLTLTVPEGNKVTLNGVALTDLYMTGTALACGECKEIEKYIKNVMMLKSYSVPGLYTPPKVAVYAGDGSEIKLTETGKDTYVFTPPVSAALSDSHSALAEQFIDAYLVYTVNGWYETDKNFDAMIIYVLSGSQASAKLYGTKFSFGQNHQFTLVSREIKTYDYRSWGDNCFSCYVDIDVTMHKWTTVYDNVKGMQLFYIYSDGVWLLAKMII